MRVMSCCGRLSLSIVKNSTLTPGRPSGVSRSVNTRSIPASHLHPITDVAKPVRLSAASRAQRGVPPVMTSRATRIVKASANVSSMSTPRTSISTLRRRRGLEHQHLASVQLDAVSGPALIAAGELRVADGQTQPAQVAQIQAQKQRHVTTVVCERRKQLRGLHRDDRPPFEPRAGPPTEM